jgi:hypothetical protein
VGFSPGRDANLWALQAGIYWFEKKGVSGGGLDRLCPLCSRERGGVRLEERLVKLDSSLIVFLDQLPEVF